MGLEEWIPYLILFPAVWRQTSIPLRRANHNLLQASHRAGHKVILETANGRELIEQLQRYTLPDIILVGINMMLMTEYETMAWLLKVHPQIKAFVLSLYSDEASIIKMLRLGATENRLLQD
jgi:DNA-binding NarL/FixJ family response regulator